MTEINLRPFTLLGPDGEIIARGASIKEAMGPLPDSTLRKEAAQLLIDAARASGLIKSIAEREDAARAAQAQQLLDRIDDINRRINAFVAKREAMAREDAKQEAQRIGALLDALPDPDDAPDPVSGGGGLRPLAPPDRERYAPNDQGALPKQKAERRR